MTEFWSCAGGLGGGRDGTARSSTAAGAATPASADASTPATARSHAATARSHAASPARLGAPIIVARNLRKTYRLGRVKVRALDDVSLRICRGSAVCIIGKSGSGKSTLLRQLGLIDVPDSGRVTIDGQDVTRLGERRRSELRLAKLGYVFQEYALLGELTAEENVRLPAMMLARSDVDHRRNARRALAIVGLGHRRRHRPKELSGGEQQRVAIARALINEPQVIFADEPTANLDSASAATVMETLRSLCRELGVTVVFVSHDPDDRVYADELVRLRDGALIAEGA